MQIPRLWLILLAFQPLFSMADSAGKDSNDVLDLNIEDLVNIQVTSVSKKAQALSDAPAAIFVISNDDIKRSGVTSIPEALRMAPGVEVARISASKWAISARGFNGTFATKLLVLIDGRSVYSPNFSGVYWDSQDVMLEDVDRIEVIRGPGATLWGANAVNGVINIITKTAESTQGGLLAAGGGNQETGFGAFRYGKKLGTDTYARAYAKGFQRDGYKTQDGLNAGDQWDRQQGGFRIDTRIGEQDELTVQGDAYQTEAKQLLTIPLLAKPYNLSVLDNAHMSGWNINSKYQHTISSTAGFKIQAYYDRYNRDEYFEGEHRDIFDIDFQHNFKLTEQQNFIWGLDYRYTQYQSENSAIMTITPIARNVQLFSGFLQDEIMLISDKLWFTLGSKFEHNDFTGFEGQPTAKLLWAPAAHHRFWASASRAVRTPSRAENDISIFAASYAPSAATFNFPVSAVVLGNPNFQSEVQFAYELGYRFTFNNQLSFDLTAFYSDYNKLRYSSIGNLSLVGSSTDARIQQTLDLKNNLKAQTAGFEMATVWQMTDWWRWDVNYTFLNTDYSLSNDTQNVSPEHKTSIRAAINPSQSTTLDLWFRYTGQATALTATSINGQSLPISEYATLDIRVGWKPLKALELSVTGQNLLDDAHLEFIDELFATQVQAVRGFYGKAVWQF